MTLPALPSADIGEILTHIPHRYPFIMIDRMEACEPGQWVRVTKNVSAQEWFFAGIPAERRVMPQMLVVEALAQSSGALCHYSGLMDRVAKPIIFFAGIDQCRFGREARPGDQLVLECKLMRTLRDVVKVSGRASVDGEMVLELQLTAVIRDMDASAALQVAERHQA
ncbi:MAG: 3-hydroxyacyl-ACP dehydratase FabZ [Betaproteobacteria bacterium]